MKTLVVIVLIFCVQLSYSQNCPYFSYAYDDVNNNEIVGRIQIENDFSGNYQLEVNVSIADDLPDSDNLQLILLSTEEDIINGVQDLLYKLRFPPTHVQPILTRLQFNGRVYCTDSPQRSFVVTNLWTRSSMRLQLQSRIVSRTMVPSVPNRSQSYPTQEYPRNSQDNPFERQPSYATRENPVRRFPSYATQPPSYGTQNYPVRQPPLNETQDYPVRQPPSYGTQDYPVRRPPSNRTQGDPVRQPPSYETQDYPVRQPPSYPTWNYTDRQPPSNPIPRQEPPTDSSPPRSPPGALTSVSEPNCGHVSGETLIASKEFVQLGKFPWMVGIMYRLPSSSQWEYRCTGNLVSSKHVIAAAHCVQFLNFILVEATNLLVVLGKVDLEDFHTGGVKVQVSDVTVHHEYIPNTGHNDIAVFTLQRAVSYTHAIKPICIWEENDDLDVIIGRSGTVAGWGRDESGNSVIAEAKFARMPVVSQSECFNSNRKFESVISNRTFCAGKRDGTGPCNGDSGAGFIIQVDRRWLLRGVLSRDVNDANRCDLENYFVFADVSKVTDWLRSIIRG